MGVMGSILEVSRKRNNRAKRKPNGKIEYGRRKPDHGTPEQILRRQELVGNGDPALSTTALGILLAHEVISREQYDAGETYAKLRFKAFGKPFPKASQMGEVVHEHITSEDTLHDFDQAQARKRYEELDRELRRKGRKYRDEVYNIAVESRFPRWARKEVHIRVSDPKRKEAFTEGLRVLQEVL